MIIQGMKFLLGRVIGLDAIPKEDRDKFLKEVAIPLLKEAVKEAAVEGVKGIAKRK